MGLGVRARDQGCLDVHGQHAIVELLADALVYRGAFRCDRDATHQCGAGDDGHEYFLDHHD